MTDVLTSITEPRSTLTAIRSLTLGHLAVLPTDTLYGIHGLASFPGMAAKIAGLKNSDPDSRGFILLADSIEKVEQWADISEASRSFIEKNCPGSVSFLLPAREDAPAELATEEDGRRRLAFRIPDHPYLLNLLGLLDSPLISTSVNQAGRPPLEYASEIVMLYGDKVDLVASDPELENRMRSEGPQPSTLVDLTKSPPVILREGKVKPILSMVSSGG